MAVAERRTDRSLREQVSQAEWEVRVDLAACYRLVAMEGWDDLVFTHISSRVPGEEGHFLMNPFGLLFEEITASSLVKIDRDGNKVLESEHEVNGPGFVIHGAVLDGRADVNTVTHLHTVAGQAVSAQAQGLLPLTQSGMFLHGDVAYHDFEGTADDLDERQRLIADLGDKHCMILRNHGTLTAGSCAADAYMRLYFLERACQVQVLATGGGADLVAATAASIAKTAALSRRGFETDFTRRVAWPALLRRLDRADPSFRD